MKKHLYDPLRGSCTRIDASSLKFDSGQFFREMEKQTARYKARRVEDTLGLEPRAYREGLRELRNLFIGQTRRMKPLPPPLIDDKEGEI